ncbi:Arylsulfatase [Anatilimnocola aggregata]|uniref:Arylsulfatase n=1 Tax=Anatilimnocola aggregata TaxID=2528021 RepID=A0A517YG58_9BACT|nr:sulfatase [Anatilimnocola aggregata]QDU29217.1 Arylsulfatase [Anatilimnocola aggregata]
MRLLHRLATLIIAAGLFCISFRPVIAEQNAASSRVPNIVLILADDLGYADLGCYGARDIRTPNIDRLAKEGTRYTSFCVAQSVCTASRAALMSGCYPHRIGMAGALNHTSKVGIHADELLLPELLHKRGYATACFGKWHLGTKPVFFPTRNGFDQWAGLPYSNDNGPLHPTVRDIPALPFYRNDEVTETDPDQSQFTKRFTRLSIEFVTANKDKPFFLYLPQVMPHVPIFASPEFKGKSKRGLYGDVVEELDAGVGELMRALDDLQLAENTLVIFLSDNGPFLSYGDHAGRAEPFREGKLTTFEGGHRMPFIVRWPSKVPAAQVRNELITALDLLPSLATITGAKLPTLAIDGVDLSPLLLGKEQSQGRDSFAYYSASELHAVRKRNWKLHFPHEYLTVAGPPGVGGKPANFANMKPNSIEQSGIRGIASRHGYRVEKIEQSLFDLLADPGEMKNVAADNAAIVTELSKLGDQFRSELGDSLSQVKGAGLRPAGLSE